MGTLGAGNHYAEIQVVDEVFDKAAARKMGIDQVGQVCIMIHSGSRGLGHQVSHPDHKVAVWLSTILVGITGCCSKGLTVLCITHRLFCCTTSQEVCRWRVQAALCCATA